MQHTAVFHLGLHCLPKYLFRGLNKYHGHCWYSFFVFSALELMKDQGSRSSRSSLSGPDMTVQYLQGLGICYNFSIHSVFDFCTLPSVFFRLS